MFNIGFAELILILLIALIVVGPKDLPKIARALGRLVRYTRNLINEVKRESGLDEMEKEFKSVVREVDESAHTADIRKELSDTKAAIDKELTNAAGDVNIKKLAKEVMKK